MSKHIDVIQSSLLPDKIEIISTDRTIKSAPISQVKYNGSTFEIGTGDNAGYVVGITDEGIYTKCCAFSLPSGSTMLPCIEIAILEASRLLKEIHDEEGR